MEANVLVIDVNKKALESLQNQFPSTSLLQLDITEEGAAHKVVQAVNDHLGGLDSLFSNAGILIPGLLNATQDDQIRKVVEVNYIAPVILSRHLLPLLLKNQNSDISFTASLASWTNIPGMANYCGTKAALQSFAKSLQREVNSINISCTYPFIVQTNLISKDDFNKTPSFVVYTPDQVAEQILWGVKEKRKNIYVSVLDRLSSYAELFSFVLDVIFPMLPSVQEVLFNPQPKQGPESSENQSKQKISKKRV